DTITRYALWDRQGNGHWVVNGVVQATDQEIDVAAANLSQVSYVAGSGFDQLWVRAYDGISWGAWTEFDVTGPVDQVPVVTAVNAQLTVHGHQNVAASS